MSRLFTSGLLDYLHFFSLELRRLSRDGNPLEDVLKTQIDAFKLWCWRRLLRVPWTARRSNQSIIKEINPEYSLERLMLKLKLQYFGHLMQRAYSLEKTALLEKIKGKEEKKATG